MKKFFITTVLLFTVIGIAVAQSPATIKKSDNDTLCQSQRIEVEIIGINGDHFNHPQHPENGIMCPFVKSFKTNGYFAWYKWESSFKDNITNNPEYTMVHIDSCGYIKVTVGDNYGHTGSDSIWFHVRNANVPPMEGFIMEIDEDLHPKFNGTATEDHKKLVFWRQYEPGGVPYRKEFSLTPGEWSYEDDVSYSEDSLWIYRIAVYDACESTVGTLIPGLLLGTVVDQYGTAWLTMKTIIQKDNGLYYGNENFVYFVYTIDEDGNRHHFRDYDGNPVVIENPWDTCWLIPAPHIDPYYQMGVGRQLGDGNYELLSLSKEVPNPWPDLDVVNENSEDEESIFAIYPNPSNGRFTVEGRGQMTVCNLLGQTILTKEIDGQTTMELPQGLYFVRLGGVVRKVVVE